MAEPVGVPPRECDLSLARAVAQAALAAGEPRHPDLHMIDAGGSSLLWAVTGSRLYEMGDEVLRALGAAADHEALDRILDDFGVTAPPSWTILRPPALPCGLSH